VREERLEYCSACGQPTGHAGYGDGSIGYVDGAIGPLYVARNRQLCTEINCECDRCNKQQVEIERLTEESATWKAASDGYHQQCAEYCALCQRLQDKLERLNAALESREALLYSLDPCPKCWGMETTEPCTCSTTSRAVTAEAEVKRLEAIVSGIDELVNDLDTGIVGANVDIDKDSSGCAVTVWGRWNDSSGSEYHAADWRDALMHAVAAKREAAEAEGAKRE